MPADDHDDQWSIHDTVETDDMSAGGGRGDIQEVEDDDHEDMTIRGPKVTSEPKTHTSPVVDSHLVDSRPPMSGHEHFSDAASSRSVPIVQVTEPASPGLPPTLHTPSPSTSSSPVPPPSPSSRTHRSTGSQEQQSRNRSITEPSRAGNRLSGFFSNLIHRRDPTSSPSARSAIREEPRPESPAPPQQTSTPPSRASSPVPRPGTPPPSLPAPTLQELGLSLSSITSNLSPSHFSTPPSSGAFLAPHYLLLCHAQGLDVLPLISPPAPTPYALVRRVSFKSVVVMEHRGVLVAIAGRRDGVRVYALEEVKKAIEWRMEVEVRRERDRMRREEARRVASSSMIRDALEKRSSADKQAKPRSSSNSSMSIPQGKLNRKPSSMANSAPPAPSPIASLARPVIKKKSAPHVAPIITPPQPVPSGPPPAYSSATPEPARPQLTSLVPVPPDYSRVRRSSVNDVLSGAMTRLSVNGDSQRDHSPDAKGDWFEGRSSSDDEAINIVAAGASGSQALDERTSAAAGGTSSAPVSPSDPARVEIPPIPVLPGRSMSSQVLGHSASRRNRPSNLDLSGMRSQTTGTIPAPQPSPTPTVTGLRRASNTQSSIPEGFIPVNGSAEVVGQMVEGSQDNDEDEDGEVVVPEEPREELTLAEALMESRIPELPPVGSRRAQQPILFTSSHPIVAGDDEMASPRTSEAHSLRSVTNESNSRRRRRWSVLDGVFRGPGSMSNPSSPQEANGDASSLQPPTPPMMAERRQSQLMRSQSFRSASALVPGPSNRPSSSPSEVIQSTQPMADLAPLPTSAPAVTSTRPHSRFIPRLLQEAFHSRRSDDNASSVVRRVDNDLAKAAGNPSATHAPAPKLEYVKLPGTKGALLIKAVETAKKSFLAILCGDNGEKVELFAGTYRTALGLSRTFILPDSPRSLELQLQGDDLVEVFLVFSQNVFGLEPATVRVREVRIGRAERRAARRRARENRTEENPGAEPEPVTGEEDTNVNVSIGVPVSSTIGDTPTTPTGASTNMGPSPFIPPPPEGSQTPVEQSNPTTSTSTEELIALATAHMGPYTTFQQLSFSPNVPLASIADDYTIPPTYASFLHYRAEHEPEVNGSNQVDLAQVNFSPPGLPVPALSPPSKWFYRDPKGIVHGPWKTSLMQAWYKDGLLPPDLPVRREEETEFILLKDLRQQSVDPTHPFRPSPPPLNTPLPLQELVKPLLPPISLLAQPKHFGPPALFFSSRGGHSTAIVDARGRSVLKGRFVWSVDDDDDESALIGRMGDVKRLEAFDVKDRAVLVAMRQGGLEAVDFGDALLKPADESRTILPSFAPSLSSINRRGPFIWRIGTPISSGTTLPAVGNAVKRHASQRVPTKKLSTGASKSPGKAEFSFGPDVVPDHNLQEEVLFLGRKDDEIYLCERTTSSFRILRLCPTAS
ncbi:hypothetical protein JAAARDRAFT_29798 [Jaapia argillacea MUCL 33604]|uniref:GYF domain-containing protein n=1 Tax=Jaapia argillacea MUCL 33604 TaxID=933084 RepID=A0A067Q9M9_9AGAM|nr:hypothetical protein JAAARDRAFT_29798 [Jaapia argillacea MUCL 33604]